MRDTAGVAPDLTSEQLRSEPARAELERAIELVRSIAEPDPVRRAARARKSLSPESAQAALAQAELRSRAVAKFGAAAESMYFTPDGLEQASRTEVARHRAGRFAAAGLASVLDLCCGIGADALAFAAAGLAVTAVERDAVTAQFAAANLANLANPANLADPARLARADAAVEPRVARAAVVVSRAEDADWRAAESVFIDPARRTDRGRTFDPAAYSPAFDFVVGLLGEVRFAAAKLGPGIGHELAPDGVEAEWVSFGGGVKEAVLWSAGFAAPGVTRRATVLPAGAQLTDADPESTAIGPVSPGDLLYEPDGAVIRAGLVRQVAALLPGGRRIDEHLAYLAADGVGAAADAAGNAAVSTPLARGFRVLDVLPFSVKRLRAELRRREVGVVEIKKRGVDVDPAALRRELSPRGPASLTVLLARVGDSRLAILAEPLVAPAA